MCSLNETFTMSRNLRTFHSAASMTLGLAGTLGNTVSIYLIYMNRLYRSGLTMALIVDLCLANLVSTLIILPMIAANSFHGNWLFGDIVCQGFGYVLYVGITTECIILMGINISQYMAIVHHSKKGTGSHYREMVKLFLLLGMPWLISTSLYVVPLVHAWDQYGYDPRKGYCTLINTHGGIGFQAVLSIAFITVISLVSVYCYSSIFLVHFKSRRKTTSSVLEAAARFRGQARNTQLIKMISAILINFSVTYIPFLVTSAVDPCLRWTPPAVYTAVIYISWSHTATNPIIYALMNTKIKAMWRVFLACKKEDNIIRGPAEISQIEIRPSKIQPCDQQNDIAENVLAENVI